MSIGDEIHRQVEDFQATLRRSRRRDGQGPYPHYWTSENFEYVLRDPGEALTAAMADHPSPAIAYVGRHGQHWPEQEVDLFHTPMGNQACYGNARFVVKHFGGKYVEGWARHNMLPPDTFVRHAWVLTPDGDPMEVTWDHTTTDYVGVVFARLPKKPNRIAITDEWALKQWLKEQEQDGQE